MLRLKYKVIALMSGTSLDGIDLICATYYFDGKWSFKIHKSETISYSTFWKEKLLKLVNMSSKELRIIDEKYSKFLGEELVMFKIKHKIENIDFIASHGHTALHQPSQGLTLQIGNLQQISDVSKEKIICDFRVQDVSLGGQGAPLVPIGDRLLFSNYDYCINLGGFANVSYEDNGCRVAFDICPVNIVLNHYVSRLSLDFDDSGNLARKGTVNVELLHKLNALSFYDAFPPKSLGLEWVKENVFPIIDSYKLEVKDILRTVVEHMAIQISKILNAKKKRVLVTGGGVYNSFLIERLESHSILKIIIPSNEIIEYKEALIFGLLGILRYRNEINCLKSVTGASKDHSSGKILNPKV